MTDLGPVQVHLHHTMTGSYPLRLVDVLFCPAQVVAVEYDYATPIDLASGGVQRRADEFAATLRNEGLAAALAAAKDQWVTPYERLAGVTVFDGGSFGREKLVLDAQGEPTRSVRIHGDVTLDAFVEAVRSVLDPFDATVERQSGLGLTASGLF